MPADKDEDLLAPADSDEEFDQTADFTEAEDQQISGPFTRSARRKEAAAARRCVPPGWNLAVVADSDHDDEV